MRARRGVAGFFVDIPALLLILVGISIFTASLYHSHTSYLERREEEALKEELDRFVENLRGYRYLAGSPGVFIAGRVERVNRSILNESYHPTTLGFRYSLEIEDNSGYEKDYSREINTERIPSSRDVYVKSTSIIIKEYNGRNHLAELRVSIWGGD